MFDIINKKPDIKPSPALPISPEEIKLREREIEQLDYITVLLERIAWIGSPGNLEFDAYRKMLREHYDALGK